MPLTLLAGPANAGKVARLLDRYADDAARDPVLIVPNRADVDRVQRELLRRTGALLGGSIGTFDDVFARLARPPDGPPRRVATEAQRALVVARVVERARLGAMRASARHAGFAEALAAAVSEVEAGLLEPEELGGELGDLYRAYRDELERLGLSDRELERRAAVARLASELSAWERGRPVYAYGFEDLTGVEWALLETLAGRTEVTVSLPYEPGRLAFAALERTADDLARLAGGRIEELPPSAERHAQPALAYLERTLFGAASPAPPPLEGALRFLEGAGVRGTLELVAAEVLSLLKAGVEAGEVVVVCPSLERVRTPLETAFGAIGVPYRLDAPLRLSQTAFGSALLALLRYAWLGGGRSDLYAFMRSPFSGLRRDHVDFLEGRLRGRAVRTPARVEEETLRLRRQSLPFLDTVRGAPSELEAVRRLVAAMASAAHGLERPPTSEAARDDLLAYDAVVGLVAELEDWLALGGALRLEEIVSALERLRLPGGRGREPGRVAVVDLLRARTLRCEVAFVLGLEEGTLPRRTQVSPLLSDDLRRELEGRSRAARLVRPDALARDRYLFYTACTRPSRRLYLVREAASDDGAPREPSPFWDDVRALFPADDVARWTRRRSLGALVFGLEESPSERERLRAVAARAVAEPDVAAALAEANGWGRRLDRARRAFARPTALRHPSVLASLRERGTFGVTELELFADCSSLWLVERLVDPRSIEGEVDARLRGQVAHQALHRFYAGLPKRLGSDRVEEDRLDDALVFLRECLDEALAGHVYSRLEPTEVQRLELEQGLWRDLEQFVRSEVEHPLPLLPRRFEVSFGSERSSPELRRGLELDGFSLSGKIDRIDVDPFSARGIVQDYKSGATAHTARQIDTELRLQIPLYMLVLRDLIGIEPLGGLYRALSGKRPARGLLRREARQDGLPGLVSRDYLDEEEFWAVVERAKERAGAFVERIRAGDVKHDPKDGSCPAWCDRWPMCRVRRA